MFKKTALALTATLATFALIVPTLATRAGTAQHAANRVVDVPPVECPFCGGSFNHVEWTTRFMLRVQKRTLLQFIGA